MQLSDVTITPDEVRQSGWREVIESASEQDCWAYATKFYQACSVDDCSSTNASVYAVLGAITSFHFTPDEAEPFGPMGEMGGKRTAIVDEITDGQIVTLGVVAPDIDNPELRARIADVVWLRKRDHRAAALAVDAYLEVAAATEDPKEWTHCADRLTRAVKLAAALGRRGAAYASAVARVEEVLKRCNGEDPLFLSAKLMELLLDQGDGDPVTYAPLAEKLARTADAEGNTLRAETYWEIAAKWWGKAKDAAKARTCRVQAGESFVTAAASAAGQGNNFVAAIHLSNAIALLRKAGGTTERVTELHKTLLEYQEKSVSEMKPVGVETDITELVRQAESAVAGKTLEAACIAFARISASQNVAKLREAVEEDLKRYPMQNLFAGVLLTDAGKVTARRPGAALEEGDANEVLVRAKMFERLSLHQGLSVQGAIEPARAVLVREHRFTLATLLLLSRRSPFVPDDREFLFARGLLAGMQGDYVSAVHILVPQVEHVLRWFLAGRGIITSGLDQDGIQDEFDLNRLLHNPQYTKVLGEILGEATVFELTGLLVERHGSNLRNMVAHGLLPSEAFFGQAACYFWWMVFRLCILGILASEQQARSGK